MKKAKHLRKKQQIPLFANSASSSPNKLLDDSEYERFIAWSEEHYDDVVEGSYINAYLKQRKTKINDWW